MSCEAEAARAIRRKGLRCTYARGKVLTELMHAGRHVTAGHIVDRVSGPSRRGPDPSTVYRTLSKLRDARLVSETLTVGGETVYEAMVSGAHHHSECRVCGAVSDIDAGYLDELKERLLEESGFAADLDHIALKGICAECRSR